jgi:hypothetical protein
MAETRFKISPPWVIMVRKLEALFDGDPMIAFNVDYNAEGGPTVILSTNDGEKAAALVKILPEGVNYGGVTLHIGVDCPNMANLAFPNNKVLFETAFKGNPAFAYAMAPSIEGYNWLPMVYVVFKNPITGAMTYVLPKINKDGSISFEVPFNNCEFSIVKTK